MSFLVDNARFPDSSPRRRFVNDKTIQSVNLCMPPCALFIVAVLLAQCTVLYAPSSSSTSSPFASGNLFAHRVPRQANCCFCSVRFAPPAAQFTTAVLKRARLVFMWPRRVLHFSYNYARSMQSVGGLTRHWTAAHCGNHCSTHQ